MGCGTVAQLVERLRVPPALAPLLFHQRGSRQRESPIVTPRS